MKGISPSVPLAPPRPPLPPPPPQDKRRHFRWRGQSKASKIPSFCTHSPHLFTSRPLQWRDSPIRNAQMAPASMLAPRPSALPPIHLLPLITRAGLSGHPVQVLRSIFITVPVFMSRKGSSPPQPPPTKPPPQPTTPPPPPHHPPPHLFYSLLKNVSLVDDLENCRRPRPVADRRLFFFWDVV